MSAIFADCGQGITSLPTKIMSCVSVQVSVVCFPATKSERYGAEAFVGIRLMVKPKFGVLCKCSYMRK
jgi:hypothetical protein